MNANQLSFGEPPHIQQVQDMWQAVGSLTTYDQGYRNTFNVFVSGKTEDIVRDFIASQREHCSINLQVVSGETALAEAKTPLPEAGSSASTPASENSYATLVDGSQLNLGISRVDIQTPPPYKIIYQVAMIYRLTDDDVAGFSFAPSWELAAGEKKTESVSFEMPEAQVRCQVKQGSVEVRLEEKAGNSLITYGPLKVKEKQECWLPENRTIPVADCAEKKWQVFVVGIDRPCECSVTYERRVASLP
ncbi:MAG TPA: hypothetical protein PKH77_15325 [Anaerolineae bacterium]|nr:hypothetical protein [Anaerolineae bacterium]